MVFNNISDFIDPLTRNSVVWPILAIATLIGGIAAVGYFIDKWQQRKKPGFFTKVFKIKQDIHNNILAKHFFNEFIKFNGRSLNCLLRRL
jgi:hypothetical protein